MPSPLAGPLTPADLLTMTPHRTHQITPTMITRGSWAEGLSPMVPAGEPSLTSTQPAGRARGLPEWAGAVVESDSMRRRPPSPAEAGHHKIARCALRPQPCSAKAARDFTCAALRDWDAANVFTDAAVVISELVTNAIRYGLGPESATPVADGRIELVLLRLADALVCAVTDPNPQAPVLMEPDYAAETGRGLGVVDALSARWGWTPLSDGCKAVWAAFPA